MPDDEFWERTPLELDMLFKRLEARKQHEYLCAGIVAATVANSAPFGDPNRRALSPLDFVPGYRPPEHRMTAYEQALELRAIMGCGPTDEQLEQLKALEETAPGSPK